MDLIAAMRVFRRVVERDSFSKAAEDLGQSAAAVSKQVRQLESHLGCLLLLRTTRTMRLSEAGRDYFVECCRLLDELDALERAIGRQDTLSGRLRINAPLSFGLTVLSPLLAEFTAQHPELELDLTLDDRVLDAIGEGFDVSLRVRASLPDSSLVARRLGEVEQWFCASPGYLRERGTPATAAELAAHDCLLYGLAAAGAFWQVDGPQGPERIAVAPRFTANNGLLLADMMAAGRGIGALPSFVAAPMLADGRLTRVLADYRFAPRGIYAVLASRRHVPRKVAAFVDFLAQALAGRGPADRGPADRGPTGRGP